MIVARWIRAFVSFWIDFILGDDWTVAGTVLAALLTAWGLHAAALPAWWLLPAAAIGIITLSLARG